MVAGQGLGGCASVVCGRDSNGFHEVVALAWMEGGGDGAGSACHKGSTQDKLLNERSGLHPTEHACGCMHCSHAIVRHQLRVSCALAVPCGLHQRLFGFLDPGRDSRNLSRV